MGIFRLLILFFIGYFIYRMLQRLINPRKHKPPVQGNQNKPDNYSNRKDIEEIDYEEIE